MDDEDSLNILQQIRKLNILDPDPHGSTILGTSNKSASMFGSNDSVNIKALFAAVEKCKIVDEGTDEFEKQKPKRGRPRKRVVQRREYT